MAASQTTIDEPLQPLTALVPQLKQLLTRHEEARQARDDAVRRMRAASSKLTEITNKRAQLLGRSRLNSDDADEIAAVAAAIREQETQLQEAGEQLARLAPVLRETEQEINDLRVDLQIAIDNQIEPVKRERVAAFESAAARLLDAGAVLAALDGVAARREVRLDLRVKHPLDHLDLALRPSKMLDTSVVIPRDLIEAGQTLRRALNVDVGGYIGPDDTPPYRKQGRQRAV